MGSLKKEWFYEGERKTQQKETVGKKRKNEPERSISRRSGVQTTASLSATPGIASLEIAAVAAQTAESVKEDEAGDEAESSAYVPPPAKEQLSDSLTSALHTKYSSSPDPSSSSSSVTLPIISAQEPPPPKQWSLRGRQKSKGN